MAINKVMLVEDDATMQSVLRTLLEIEGFQVAVVSDTSGEAAVVEAIRQETPDVVLMDVHLKGSNGLDILRKMRSDPVLQSSRVIMSSGMPMKEQCLEAGANDFLLKPYMPDELIDKIKG